MDLTSLRKVLLLTWIYINLEKYEPLFEDTSIRKLFKYADALLVRLQQELVKTLHRSENMRFSQCGFLQAKRRVSRIIRTAFAAIGRSAWVLE